MQIWISLSLLVIKHFPTWVSGVVIISKTKINKDVTNAAIPLPLFFLKKYIKTHDIWWEQTCVQMLI